ncbi:thiamine pyrophosphate-dependent enzyme [Gallaecimonas sp. GXIMD1310]|uniref:thiamine pyrophosphate-dependent enzyme n=1 Tax=Gallaecimonas sp. GXIMD1310 TaxID=3131926 RepID=UPI0032458BDA
MNLSGVLLKVLVANGVRQLFGIPGDAINAVTDAVRRQDDIQFIQVRHEEAGAFAASAQAKLTGQLSACLGTAGPGAIHLLNGLYDARLDHAPVLAITGQVETGHLGSQYHQEVNLDRLFADVAVYSRTVVDPAQLPKVAIEACQAALAHGGVAHIALPANLAAEPLAFDELQQLQAPRAGRLVADPDSSREAVALLNRAKKPVILAGIGAKDAAPALRQLAERLQAPIIRTLKAKDFIDDNDPLCIGGLGLLGGKPAVKAIEQCDLLLMLGTDFPYQAFYPTDAKVIQVDTHPGRIGRRHPVTLGVVADVAQVLPPWLEALASKETGLLSPMREEKQTMLAQQEADESSTETPIHPARLLTEVAKAAPDDAIFTVDTGTVTAWAARHLRLRGQQRFVLSGGLASMAFAFSGAIGAQLAYPRQKVFALCGDGAFTMLMGDFVTAVKYQLPLVVVVLNNHKLGFITLEQESAGLPDWGTDLTNPDFAALANACGGEGISITDPDEIAPALARALASDGPVLLDVQTDPNALIMPPKVELSQAVSFGVAKLKEQWERW